MNNLIRLVDLINSRKNRDIIKDAASLLAVSLTIDPIRFSDCVLVISRNFHGNSKKNIWRQCGEISERRGCPFNRVKLPNGDYEYRTILYMNLSGMLTFSPYDSNDYALIKSIRYFSYYAKSFDLLWAISDVAKLMSYDADVRDTTKNNIANNFFLVEEDLI